MVLPIPVGVDKLVFDYLGQLFKFAEEHNFRFPGRSALAAVTLMKDNLQRGRWVSRAIMMLAQAGFMHIPLPSPEVCEILGLVNLAKSLRAAEEK